MHDRVQFVEVQPRGPRNPGFAANVMAAVEQQLLREQRTANYEVDIQINIRELEIIMSESTARRLLSSARPAMR